MNFLSPWFLLGALAVAGPIVFHLIRLAVKERMPFSSLMFLSPTPPRLTRRRKLEHLWLLVLRCLCLVLLAVGFARPFLAKDSPLPSQSGENRQTLLLLDTSASMRREGLWNQARAIAGRYLEKPGDQVAIMTFDRQAHALMSFTEWSSWPAEQRATLAGQRLAAVSPGWMGTQLGLALTSAAELFVDDPAAGKPVSRRELVLITDLQEGSKLDGLQGHEWPSGVNVIIERVEAPPHANAGLEILNEPNSAAGADSSTRVRVTNARDSNREKFRLGWETATGVAEESMEIYLPPGQTRSFSAPRMRSNPTVGKLLLTGDETDFDNQSFYAAPEIERIRIAWFGLESANDPQKLRYYVQRVFPETHRRQIQIAPPTAQSVFSPELLNQAAFAVIPSSLAADEIAAVRDWLSRGKTALMVLTDPQMKPTLAALTELNEVQITEGAGDYALLGQIDFTHPLFAPFADPRFSDFSHIHYWKHRRVEIPLSSRVRVIAKFDDGSPALAQISVGKGNLLVLASGWNPADSQLAVSSKFPPLMQTMLDWSLSASSGRFLFTTGESIPSPVTSGGDVQWKKPDGKSETLAAAQPFTGTDLPGIYSAAFSGKERRFAVNLPLDESRTAPMSPDELARLGVPLQTATVFPAVQPIERQRHLQQGEAENRQKLWRWLIVGALAITFGEIILSGWLARRVKTVEVAP